jgi:hypothetical protein
MIRYGLSLITVFLLGGWLSAILMGSREKTDDDREHQEAFNRDYRVYSLNLPENLTFAGEKVPLNDLDILERLDRELLVNTYWQSNTLLAHKRAHKWFPVIEPILKKNGVPDDFKYLAVIESNLSNTVSPSGATGFWQLLEAAAKENGLEVNEVVDERYDVAKSTEAACRYLKTAYSKYGSWAMAAASYNMGINGLEKQKGRQGQNGYYDLILNSETSRYVFRMIAMKLIIENPRHYGFVFREKDLYRMPPVRTVTLDSSVTDMVAYADSVGVNYRVLKIFNPWMRENFLKNPGRKAYKVVIPREGYRGIDAHEAEMTPPMRPDSASVPSPSK